MNRVRVISSLFGLYFVLNLYGMLLIHSGNLIPAWNLNNIPQEYSLLEPISRPNVNCSCGDETEEIGYFKWKRITRGEFPWLVRIFDINRPNDFLCLGTVINDRYILTAASGLSNFRNKKKVGRIGVNLLGAYNTTIIYPVSKIQFHNGFNKHDKLFQHDVALVRLAKRIDFKDPAIKGANPACINQEVSASGKRGAIMGTTIWWKHSRKTGYDWINHYGKENVTGMDNRICSVCYPKASPNTTLCVHRDSGPKPDYNLLNENSDYFCHIAPGTPLMKILYEPDRNSSVIVGMATKISSCSTLNTNINIFLSIQDYIPWVLKNAYDGTFCN